MGSGLKASVLTGLAAFAAMIAAAGCIDAPAVDSPNAYDYTTKPVLITNSDWGVIPLPNNFLNPVKQAEFVYIPGVPLPDAAPVNMALPIVDKAAADARTALGYPTAEDTDLTKSLVTGMNRLDGWVTSFAPKIPFSMLPAYDSIVPYDGTNGSSANLFFMDITDPAVPVVITADKYYRIVNWEGATQMPYYLSLRLAPPGPLQAPLDFTPGHTYAIVVTGNVEETAVQAVVGQNDQGQDLMEPVLVDNTFLVFAANDREEELFKAINPITEAEVGLTYITNLGAPVNSVLTELPAVQQAEGARQITNYVIKVWEQLPDVAGSRDRNEIVAAFQWTTVSNPMGAFFNASNALMGSNPLSPAPADYVDGTGALVKADASCSSGLGFQFKTKVDHGTVNTDTVKLYKVEGAAAKTLTEIPVAVTPSIGTDAATGAEVTSVLIKQNADLSPSTEYLVVVTNGVTNETGTRTAVDETYFGLTRVGLPIKAEDGTVTGYSDLPLISDDGTGKWMWNSPNLDSRLDTLILNFTLANGVDPVSAPIRTVTDEDRAAAKDGSFMVDGKFGVITILKLIEGLRKVYKPMFDAVVIDKKLVSNREDIVLAWTFTTGACN